MNRRDTLAAIAAICTAPHALAQPASKAARIALFDTAEPPANMTEGGSPVWGALLSELRRLGHVEGKTVVIERWSGGGDTGAYGEVVRKIVDSQIRVIVARGRTATQLLAATTSTIPIISIGTISSDLRAGFARPGGNVTGLHTSADEQQIYSKQLEFLRELTRAGAKVAWLGPQLHWDGPLGTAARLGASRSKLVLLPVFVSSPVNANAINRAVAAAKAGDFEGILVSASVEMFPHRTEIAKLAVEARMPTVATSFYADAGILVSYGAPVDELFRRAAHYVDKILKGAKAGELPIELPGKILLVLNLKTAKLLRITIPQSLLLRADRVIE